MVWVIKTATTENKTEAKVINVEPEAVGSSKLIKVVSVTAGSLSLAFNYAVGGTIIALSANPVAIGFAAAYMALGTYNIGKAAFYSVRAKRAAKLEDLLNNPKKIRNQVVASGLQAVAAFGAGIALFANLGALSGVAAFAAGVAATIVTGMGAVGVVGALAGLGLSALLRKSHAKAKIAPVASNAPQAASKLTAAATAEFNNTAKPAETASNDSAVKNTAKPAQNKPAA